MTAFQLLALAIALFMPLVNAATNATPNATAFAANALDADQIQSVSQSLRWTRMLHYGSGKNATSQVDDADFFLAQDGRSDPQQELIATINAFYLPLSDPDQHPVCRYPARWQFLSSEFDLPAPPITPQHCPEFSQWFNAMNPDSASLVLASSYLNSPSSMFGHTFLRIDPADVEKGSKWLSYAINYGAKLNAQDNSLLYAYKGIFGGYPGFFSVIPYYEKIREYSHLENRDLWEYNLDLSPQETRAMVTHLWELRDIEFDYYFFDENCSYRLLELLEFARPSVQLTDDFSYRAIPIDTVRSVLNAGLVRSVDYRPSASTEIEYQLGQLDQQQQRLAWQLARQKIKLDDPQLSKLNTKTRKQVMQLAYQHLRYLQLNNRRDPATAQYSLDLLRAIRPLPGTSTAPPTPHYSPDQGHATFLVAGGGGAAMDSGFVDARIRLSYHDLADDQRGYLKGASINLGELQLRKTAGAHLQIEDLSLVDIRSHSPRSQFFNPVTWRVQMGMERLYSEHDDYLTTQAHGGAGVTYGIAKSTLVYGLAMGRLEYNELLGSKGAAGIGGLAGGLVYLPFGTLQLESQYYQFSNGENRHQTQLIQNLPLGENSALRFSASHNKQVATEFDEFSLEFRYYF